MLFNHSLLQTQLLLEIQIVGPEAQLLSKCTDLVEILEGIRIGDGSKQTLIDRDYFLTLLLK